MLIGKYLKFYSRKFSNSIIFTGTWIKWGTRLADASSKKETPQIWHHNWRNNYV